MFRGESQHQHQQEIPTRCSTTEPSGPRSRPPRWSDSSRSAAPRSPAWTRRPPRRRASAGRTTRTTTRRSTRRRHGPCTTARPPTRSSAAWGVYQGLAEMSWMPYLTAGADQKALLDKIVQRPKATWFGHWQPDGDITDRVREVHRAHDGRRPGGPRPDLDLPHGARGSVEACKRLPTAAEQASYKTWIDGFVAGVGDDPHGDHHAAGRPVRAVRPGRLEGAVEADQVRRPQAQRAAQHQRLHRRRAPPTGTATTRRRR